MPSSGGELRVRHRAYPEAKQLLFPGGDSNLNPNPNPDPDLILAVSITLTFYFQAETAQATLKNNICFNIPRAAVNFNDGQT